MATTTTPGIAAHIAVIGGQPTTTTQDIADVYGKRHNDVLRIVRQRMNAVPEEWRLRNFAQTVIERSNPSGGAPIQSPAIRMTKKGFHFVVGKFTGAKAVEHQLAFADEFERMEAQLHQPNPALGITQKPTETQVACAIGMGHAIAGHVQQSVAMAVLRGGDDWKHQRYLLSFITDSKIGSPPMVELLAHDDRVLSQKQVVKLMADAAISAWDRILGGIRGV